MWEAARRVGSLAGRRFGCAGRHRSGEREVGQCLTTSLLAGWAAACSPHVLPKDPNVRHVVIGGRSAVEERNIHVRLGFPRLDAFTGRLGYSTLPEPFADDGAYSAARQDAGRIILDQLDGLYPRAPRRLQRMARWGLRGMGYDVASVTSSARRTTSAAPHQYQAPGGPLATECLARPLHAEPDSRGLPGGLRSVWTAQRGLRRRGAGPLGRSGHPGDGRRCSTAVRLPHPAMSRPNLAVEPSFSSTVLFEGDRAIRCRPTTRRDARFPGRA